MNLIRTIFWIVLFVASTFCFLVVFNHGFKGDFVKNSKATFENFRNVLGIVDGPPKPAEAPK
jgi:hypothetical protein